MEKDRILECVRVEIEKIYALCAEYITSDISVDKIEKSLLHQLLQLGLSLLKMIISARIASYYVQSNSILLGSGYQNKGLEKRVYKSLFGNMHLSRSSYWSKDTGKIHPADGALGLPVGSQLSYNLQELLGESAAENDYEESIRMLNKVLSLKLSGKGSERNMGHLGASVEDFYKEREVVFSKVEDTELIHFSASFDGKGVPRIKEKKAVGENPKKRLGKGEKRGVMEMATVCVTSSFTAKKREVKDIVKCLTEAYSATKKSDNSPSDSKDNHWHENIHRRAYLGNQAKSVEYGLDRVKEGLKADKRSRFVVPIDAGIGLEDRVMEWVEKNAISDQFDGIILDIIHVSEYVWEAANAIFGEKAGGRSHWVADMLTDILNSKTKKVIADLKKITELKTISESKKKQVEKTIAYFSNHQHKMDYQKFIDKGYPISSALVESTCGHLVKDRMEQSGMRWSAKGAQNVLDVRAVKINGDLEYLMNYIKESEQNSQFKLAA